MRHIAPSHTEAHHVFLHAGDIPLYPKQPECFPEGGPLLLCPHIHIIHIQEQH